MARRHMNVVCQRGVSLIEAMIAMAVMGFGMLAIVGVQSNLRFNADMSKQRAEATRLAEQELELVRAFSKAGSGGATETEFDKIASKAEVSKSSAQFNAEFKLTRGVIDAPDGISKMLVVVVKWVDRTGESREISMHDMISRVDPMLSGFVKAERPLTAIGKRSGRHPTIPVDAVNLPGDSGKSIFLPPNAAGGTAWVFNNWTGAITNRCTGIADYGSVSASTVASNCTTLPIAGQLVSGVIRFNLRGATRDLSTVSVLKPAAAGNVAWVINNGASKLVQICSAPAGTATSALTVADVSSGCTNGDVPISPFAPTDASHTLDAADSESPGWPTLPAWVTFDETTISPHRSAFTHECFADYNASVLAPLSSSIPPVTKYFCIVIPNSTTGWGGRTIVKAITFSDGNAATWEIGSAAGKYRVCRYTRALIDHTDNDDHPGWYSADTPGCASTCRPVTGNLINQNFLVIDGTKTCPSESSPVDPANGNFFNSNTRLHQS
jgi:Tfp pilus assembly protein PilE